MFKPEKFNRPPNAAISSRAYDNRLHTTQLPCTLLRSTLLTLFHCGQLIRAVVYVARRYDSGSVVRTWQYNTELLDSCPIGLVLDSIPIGVTSDWIEFDY
ncbi:Protein of unknown function [Cotesia congregata]|uniref:Uncharacterized protein n=1 Tax=Cotesia congregata TaxID=51543 RepID=A0A8J2HJP6_COTCN|nr:Protein of unknown function [Cotesia congregata]